MHPDSIPPAMLRLLLFVLLAAFSAAAQSPDLKLKHRPPPSESQKSSDAPAKAPAAEAALERAIADSGNDIAARVRTLEAYLKEFPEAPRKAGVYRALAEAAVQLRDFPKAIDYSERLIALHPEDSAMMLFAADLLEKQGDARSLVKAAGYLTRVLDRIEKDPAGEKPVRMSHEDWDLERRKLRMSVYSVRGRIAMAQKKYDAATADLKKSYELIPNTPAALRLGQIAELQKQTEEAIAQYACAFVLPDSYGTMEDQLTARRSLGNLWRQTRGSETGLGDYLLAAFDRATTEKKRGDQPLRNAGIQDPFAMEIRRLDGSNLKLAELKGKVVVLYFWATWCGPCRELEPLIEAAFEKYESQPRVVFLAVNRDEDELLVAPYVKKEKVRMPATFSDGLERALRVESIPTVVVFDPAGNIAYRVEGFEPEGFLRALSAAIERGLAQPPAAKSPN